MALSGPHGIRPNQFLDTVIACDATEAVLVTCLYFIAIKEYITWILLSKFCDRTTILFLIDFILSVRTLRTPQQSRLTIYNADRMDHSIAVSSRHSRILNSMFDANSTANL